MAPDELAVEVIEHVGDGEVAIVGGHLRVEENLQQQVAELLGKVRKVTALDGVEDLVGLFERVFANGVEGLFAVPGASAGCAQAGHDGHRLLEKSCSPRRISGTCSGCGGGWLWSVCLSCNVHRC